MVALPASRRQMNTASHAARRTYRWHARRMACTCAMALQTSHPDSRRRVDGHIHAFSPLCRRAGMFRDEGNDVPALQRGAGRAVDDETVDRDAGCLELADGP